MTDFVVYIISDIELTNTHTHTHEDSMKKVVCSLSFGGRLH